MPEVDGDWTLEHTHRYFLACELAHGKRVLDLASGDGYGSMLLSATAAHVTGVDISSEAIARAKEKYQRDNLTFIKGSAVSIPLPDAAVDLVVSFETIEHLQEHESMLAEFRRVLAPGGLLLISSPDKYEYSDLPGYQNPYHVRELYRDEFIDFIQSTFPKLQILGQRVVFGSAIIAEDPTSFFTWSKGDVASRAQGLSNAEYIIVLASDGDLPSLPSSLLKTSIADANKVRGLEEHRDSILEHMSGLQEHIANLETEIKQIAVLQEALALTQARAKLSSEALQSVLSSHSWKVTAPVRWLGSKVRALLGK